MALTDAQQQAVQNLIDAQPALNNAQFGQLMDQLRAGGRKEKARLPEFSSLEPSDWRTFRLRVIEAKSLNGWTEQEAKQHLKISMAGEAAVVTRDIAIGGNPDAAPVPADAKTFNEYLDEVGLRFISAAATELAISDFVSAEQKAGETIQQWFARELDLYTTAYPHRNHDTDADLIRLVCVGLIDEVVKHFVMDNRPATFRRALELAQQKEGVQAQCRRAAKRRGRVNALSSLAEDVHGPEEGVGAINYSYGSATPSSADANRRLRASGPQFGMSTNFAPPQYPSNSFLGPPRPGGNSNPGAFGRRRQRRGAPQGRGGRRNRGRRGGGGGRSRQRGGRANNQRRVNAMPDYAETVSHLGELFNSVDLSGGEAHPPNSGNSARPGAK